MPAIETQEIVDRLRAGKLSAADGAELETVSMQTFIQELRAAYPIVFQERTIRSKYETSLAAASAFAVEFKQVADEVFLLPIPSTKFRNCVFVNGYNDVVSGISAVAGVRVSANPRRSKHVLVRMGRGFKFDKFPDGWELRPIDPTATKLSIQFLKSRGWRFGALLPGSGGP